MDPKDQSFEEAFAEAVAGTLDVPEDTASPAPDAPENAPEPTPEDTATPPSDVEENPEPSPVPDNQSDRQDTPAAPQKLEPEPDYKTLFERSEQARKSLEGRIDAQKEEYQRRLKKLESGRPQKPAVSFDPDEVEKEEIEAFRQKHPEISKVTIDGAKGSAWQKMLVNHGEDEVLTLYEVNSDVAEGMTAEVKDELGRRAEKEHYSAIEAAHPGWMQLVSNPNPKDPSDVFNPEFAGFVMGLPYADGQVAVNIIKSGTPQQVIALLSYFKDWQAKRNAPPVTPKEPKPQKQDPRRVTAAAPVRGRSTGIPPAAPDPNDFDSAWAEATGTRR